MQTRIAICRLAALAALTTGLSVSQVCADEIWHNDWFAEAPAPFFAGARSLDYHDKPWTSFGFGADGDVVILASPSLAGMQSSGSQFVRISPAGQLRWVSNRADSLASNRGAHSIQVEADGSAYAAFGDPDNGEYEDKVVRQNSDGTIAWERYLPTGWLALAGSSRMASLGCSRLTLLDSTNGDVIWERLFDASLGSLCDGGLAADEQGNLYATVATRSETNGLIPGFRALKTDTNGVSQWSIATTLAGGGSLLGVGGGKVYVRTSIDMRALDVTTGSLLWATPVAATAKTLMSGGNPSEPIVVSTNTLYRIDGTTGQARWSQSLGDGGATFTADIVEGSIIVETSSSFSKFDLASGAMGWTQPSAGLRWDGFGGSDGSTFFGVAQAASLGLSSSLKRIDLQSGTFTNVPIPAITQGINATSVLDDESNVVNAGMLLGSNSSELHLRRVNSVTGAVLWDVTHSLGVSDPIRWSLESPQLAVAGAVIATAISSYSADACNSSTGAASISLHEKATGQERWHVVLEDVGERCAWISAPAIDPDGNVFEAVGAVVSGLNSQGTPEVRAKRTLYKFDANTGALLWRQDTDGGTNELYLQIFPQAFSLVGSDVLLHAPFLAGSQDTLRRISGADGSVQWASTQFHELGGGIGDSTYRIDASHVVVFAGTSGSIDWAALDVNTGATSWASSAVRPACTPPQSCNFAGGELLQNNGDLLTSGELGFAPSLRRYHNDGSGLVDNWNPGSGDALLFGALTNLWNDVDGALRVYLYHGFGPSRGALRFLSTFDFNSGGLLGKQAIYAFDPNALMWSYPQPLGAPLVDRLLVSTLGPRSSMPTTSGTALLDTSVSAHGNLAISLSLDRASVQAGDTLGFHLTATYSGDLPISVAHLFALMPWQGGVTALNCSGSNCVFDTRSGNVSATFDIAPGGSVDITGKVRVLDHAVYPQIYARTWGPLGLSEQDILDNFAHAAVTQSLFADGFEG